MKGYKWLENNFSTKTLKWLDKQNKKTKNTYIVTDKFKTLKNTLLKESSGLEYLNNFTLVGGFIVTFIKTSTSVHGLLIYKTILNFCSEDWKILIDFDTYFERKLYLEITNILYVNNSLKRIFIEYTTDSLNNMQYLLFHKKTKYYECYSFSNMHGNKIYSGTWISYNEFLFIKKIKNKQNIICIIKFNFDANTEIQYRIKFKRKKNTSFFIKAQNQKNANIFLLIECVNRKKYRYYLFFDFLYHKKLTIPKSYIFIGFFKKNLVFKNENNIFFYGMYQLNIVDEICFNSYGKISDVAILKDYILVLTVAGFKTTQYLIYQYKNKFHVKMIMNYNRIKFTIQSIDKLSNKYLIREESIIRPPCISHCKILNRKQISYDLQPPVVTSKDYVCKEYTIPTNDGHRCSFLFVSKENVNPKYLPTIITAYGGFNNISIPKYSFYVDHLWLQKGGAYVYVITRGDANYLDSHKININEWINAPNDLVSVIKYLIENKITSHDLIGLRGGSHGGILLGNMLLKYSKLFKTMVCSVPVLDLIDITTTNIFKNLWSSEYLLDTKNYIKKERIKISPYLNIKNSKIVKYNKALFMSASHDTRVNAYQARKMVAKLIDNGHDVYYYENYEGSHWGGGNYSDRLEWILLEFSFFHSNLFL